MSQSANQPAFLKPIASSDLAGSQPCFPGTPGDTLSSALALGDFCQKRLLFNRIALPGQIHVYSADCVAGERLFAQLHVPILPLGGAVTPAFAVIAQSLPYSADVRRLPFALPAGFSAVVAAPPSDLLQPMEDVLTRARYYPGPTIDTKTLVGGRCYLVVWSPQNQMGKYLLQIGHRWPMRAGYWLGVPAYWWQIRGWFGLSRAAAWWATAGALVLGVTLMALLRKGKSRSESLVAMIDD